MTKTKNIVLSSEEVNERGKVLLQRLRNNGVWQYSRWFVDKATRYTGNGTIQDRMQRIVNNKGTSLDTNLLLEMEKIANKYLQE